LPFLRNVAEVGELGNDQARYGTIAEETHPMKRKMP
jgi:hypothetical protein